MGLVWIRSESARFQAQVKHNLPVWKRGLASWRQQIDGLHAKLGSGPNAALSGKAWNAAKTLFVDRIGPIVDSGLSACAQTETHLHTYAASESPLLGDSVLREDSLQSAKDHLDREIYEATHWWFFPTPWTEFDEDVKKLRRQAATLQKKLDHLRTFARVVNGLFNAEVAMTAHLSASVSSIQNGKLSADGVYSPASGDSETWLKQLVPVCPAPPAADPALIDLLIRKMSKAAKEAGLSDDEIKRIATDIATMVASADEPYKSLFYQNIDKVDIVGMTTDELNQGKPAYYEGWLGPFNSLHLNFQQMSQDAPPYHTFFHEMGHAIDDCEETFGTKTSGYKLDGRTVFDYIKSDVENDIYQQIIDAGLKNVTPEEARAMARAYVNRDQAYINSHSTIASFVSGRYQVLLVNDEARSAGDIYNGVTGGMIPAKWTHSDPVLYPDKNNNGLSDDYWFGNGDNRKNNAHESELWAGFYADQMVNPSQVCSREGDTPSTTKINLTVTEDRFPGTARALEAMAEEMKNN